MEISSINVTENDIIKNVTSPDYNYTFDKTSGLFKRWGSSEKDDPVLAPSPEIADIEVTTICQGLGGNVTKGALGGCVWCALNGKEEVI